MIAFLTRLEKSKDFWFLLFGSFLFFILRLPSLIEPNWYGDEGIYQVIGYALNHGRTLYSGIWDNKPPLLYIVYALFDGDQTGTRFFSVLFGVASLIAFFFVAKRLFNSNKAIYVTSGLFGLLFGLPLLEGNIANAENFMLLPILLSANLILSNKIEKKSRRLFAAGVLLSLAFLFKVVAVFDAAAFAIFLFFITYKNAKEIKTQVKNLLPFTYGFISPVIITLLIVILQGSFKQFLTATLTQNVGYVGYANKFIIPQGLLILKTLLILLYCLVLFAYRKKFKTPELFLFIWLPFEFYSAFFSQRPYTHYLLMLLSSFCLFLGLLIWEKRLQKITTVAFFVVLILVLHNFTFYGKTISYYGNYLSFITGGKSVTNYQAFFDSSTPRDYELAQYINLNTKEKDNIFIWGNSAQIYRLANKLPPGRFTVAYHIIANKDTVAENQAALSQAKPKFIIILQNAETYPYSLSIYKQSLFIKGASIYEYAL